MEKKKLQATWIQTDLFGVVVPVFYAYSSPYALRLLCLACFRVFHLDNHGSWEHQRRFCLCSVPLVDLSA